MSPKIFIFEDETDLVTLLTYNLEKNGFSVVSQNDGNDAVAAVQRQKPDLVLLDVMLPGTDGFGVCRLIKAEESTRHIPIMMLTARDDEASIVTGLELGADDFLSKPFSISVLVARIRAILRRSTHSSSAAKATPGVVLDHEQHEVRLDGQVIDLSLTEFQLLDALIRQPGRVHTRQQLIDQMRGEDYYVTDRIVDVAMVSLRRKLGAYSQSIQTVRGVGYKFKRS